MAKVDDDVELERQSLHVHQQNTIHEKKHRRTCLHIIKDPIMLAVIIIACLHVCYSVLVYFGFKVPLEPVRYYPSSDTNAGNSANGEERSSSDGIFIAVKTTQNNHHDRINSILDTWYNFAPRDIAFFTDASARADEAVEDNVDIQVSLNSSVSNSILIRPKISRDDFPTRKMSDMMLKHPTRHRLNLIDTECLSDHSSTGLCCKTAAEFQYFHGLLKNYGSNYKWMCHVDDDTFLNYPQLKQYLEDIEEKDNGEEHYIGYSPYIFKVNKGGRTALEKGGSLKAIAQNNIYKPPVVGEQIVDEKTGITIHNVQYGTGGAGWCLSARLVERGIDDLSTNFVETCKDVEYSDDVTLGFVVQVQLGVLMKNERRFHSHLDNQTFSSKEEAMNQLTFGSGHRRNSFFFKNMFKKAKTGRELKRRFSFVEYPDFKVQIDTGTGEPRQEDPMGFRQLYCNFWPEKCTKMK